ncbi:MAG: general secretion pathway protein GspE [Deltaproteobacteria bacterium]|nr:MAG: general secretion pathway protein GspE [Deltaproteobacteria bacterium]
MKSQPRKRMRLGELLVAAGVLDETRLKAALAEQRKWGGKLGRVLVDMGFVSEDLMVKALSKQLGLSRVDLDKATLPQNVTQYLGVDVCERYGVFPVERDDDRKILRVATADPTNYEALDEVSFRTGMKVEPVVAAASAVDRAIRRYYYGERTVPSDTLDPSAYGLRDGQQFDLNHTPAHGVMVAAGRDGASPELVEALGKLEQTLAAEVRALRSLVELLVESGVIRREDFLAKLRRK